MTGEAGRGVWLGASHVLGRPVAVDGPYPHICGTSLEGLMTRRQVRLNWRNCAACAIAQASPDRPESQP